MFNFKEFMDYEYLKSHVVMVAVNTERNAKLLSEVPHMEKEDLSLIYKLLVSRDEKRTATITIRNEHLPIWGIDADELQALAYENTRKLLPVTIQSMDEVMRELLERDGKPPEMVDEMLAELPSSHQTYIISNAMKLCGAASMFYLDSLCELSHEIGTDLYILPSSIHEVIAVSADIGEPKKLAKMVKEVNTSEVSEEEQLSDHVYYFDALKKTLSLADTTIEALNKAPCACACCC